MSFYDDSFDRHYGWRGHHPHWDEHWHYRDDPWGPRCGPHGPHFPYHPPGYGPYYRRNPHEVDLCCCNII